MPLIKKIILLFSIIVSVSNSQINFYRNINNPLIKGYDNPLTGGIGQPCVSLTDANNDGKPDLFLLNYNTNLSLYLNKGDWKFDYQYNHEYEITAQARFVLADLNADKYPDFITTNNFSQMVVYRNVKNNEQTFNEENKDTIKDNLGNYIYLVGDILPAFADIDHDFDLDLFVGNIDGSISIYENIGNKENYVFKSGKPFSNILVVSGKNIKYDSENEIKNITKSDESRIELYKPKQKLNALHGGCTLTFSDYDEDDDLDLFFGDLNMNTILMFKNIGNKNLPGFNNNQHDTVFKNNGGIISTEGYNQIVFGDIDGDGDKDAVVSQFRNTNKNKKLLTLENIGNNKTPYYVQKNIDLTNDFDLGAYSSFSLLRDKNGDRIFASNGNGDIQLLRYKTKDNVIEIDSIQLVDAPGSTLYLASVAQNIKDTTTNAEIVIGTQEGDLRLMKLSNNNKLFRINWNLDTVKWGQPISPTFCNCGENFEYGILCGLANGKFVFYKKIDSSNSYMQSKPVSPFDTLDVGYDASVCSSYGLNTKSNNVDDVIAVGGRFLNNMNSLKIFGKGIFNYEEKKQIFNYTTAPYPKPMFINNIDGYFCPMLLLVGSLNGGLQSYRYCNNSCGVSDNKEYVNSSETLIKSCFEGNKFEINLNEIFQNLIIERIVSEVKIYNIIGKGFNLNFEKSGDKLLLSTEHLKYGVYFINIISQKKNQLIKLIIY